MKQRLYLHMCFYVIVLMCFISCASTSSQKSTEDTRSEKQILIQKFLANPSDVKALVDLGVLAIDISKCRAAQLLFSRSAQLDPENPKITFYHAMSLECSGKESEAMAIYGNYKNISSSSPYRNLMEGRYRLLTRKKIRAEMQALLAQESMLGIENISPNAIAIFPLSYQGDNQEYETLGRGISEMMITDLSQLPDLQLIERVRLQALFEEITLGQTGLVDETYIPRYGKLLGAGRIVNGVYSILDEEDLRVDVEMWDMIYGQEPLEATRTDNLARLFMLEKQMVFGIIDEMGIELTQEQRDQIMYVPTKNLQAFMDYCRGLAQEDAGNFLEATMFYQSAATLDPDFTQAQQRAHENETLLEAGHDIVEIVENVKRIDRRRMEARGPAPLVGNRLQHLSNNLGSNFVPGQDTREAVEELTSAGVELRDNLPAPPDPPTRRNQK